MITAISHVNLLVPPGTLKEATEFYAETLGLTATPVPQLQRETLAWFNITPDGSQQIHIAFGPNEPNSRRHPCLRVGSLDDLQRLQQRIWDHHLRGGPAAPLHADQPGESSGSKGVEYPTRFFARDYAGNRIEFSL
ncbi:putative glyoxalase family protein [Aspergillus clavatus NRRL 1]|uniref:Glyoxalase family protein, putative n=1 Tax=Aspergillus clavatus (strain ATCC 1007 / CBS 513.65 / DSM 816 / NCTC 3887 / NRRL 1 / QM 1276 / 107) TaxID=344612 RepID=A1CLI9_ASPCL|nr:glyoxalase family protein, putative [Aspergillus clavatus NRRL 1]EAW10013.1 glyoxalase family protein, putative [Aspergillus clavatus NRRL 1]